MSEKLYSVIIGSGSYIPTRKITNADFMNHVFYEADGKKVGRGNEDVIRKFSDITGIFERRYVTDDLVLTGHSKPTPILPAWFSLAGRITTKPHLLLSAMFWLGAGTGNDTEGTRGQYAFGLELTCWLLS